MDTKKATTDGEKVEILKHFLKTICTVDSEHSTLDSERLLIEMDISNEKDLETAATNESHKNIEKKN